MTEVVGRGEWYNEKISVVQIDLYKTGNVVHRRFRVTKKRKIEEKKIMEEEEMHPKYKIEIPPLRRCRLDQKHTRG